jgi:glycosyltransferase involved in cell wall biosynthesis
LSKQLSIWHLCSNRWNSAITEYALSAARALALAGHETLFIAKVGSPAAKRAAVHLPTREIVDFSWRGMLDLWTLVRKKPPDIVVVYGGAEAFLASLLKATRPLKVLRFQGQALTQRSFQQERYRLAHRHVDLILTPSVAMAAAVRRLHPWQQVVPVVLGCDADRLQRPASAEVPAGRPEMLIFGRLDPVKGHQAMVARFASLLKSWDKKTPAPRLHIIGEPANLSVADLMGYASAAGLRWGDDVVVSVQRLADVAATLSNACLGVISSLGSEVICRVAEEFLLCGTPVAVSGVGSLGEVLFPGAGFNYGQMSDEEATAAFSHWLALSAGEGVAAKNARAQAARREFSLEAMANALSNALRLL